MLHFITVRWTPLSERMDT